MSVQEKLNTVKNSLADIKTAIIGKGVTPGGNITTYASAINNIETSGGVETVNFIVYNTVGYAIYAKINNKNYGSNYTVLSDDIICMVIDVPKNTEFSYSFKSGFSNGEGTLTLATDYVLKLLPGGNGTPEIE